MTENEMKLLEVIRESSDPEKALITAIEVIIRYLEQSESSE